jgi:hypothetical protein
MRDSTFHEKWSKLRTLVTEGFQHRFVRNRSDVWRHAWRMQTFHGKWSKLWTTSLICDNGNSPYICAKQFPCLRTRMQNANTSRPMIRTMVNFAHWWRWYFSIDLWEMVPMFDHKHAECKHFTTNDQNYRYLRSFVTMGFQQTFVRNRSDVWRQTCRMQTFHGKLSKLKTISKIGENVILAKICAK